MRFMVVEISWKAVGSALDLIEFPQDRFGFTTHEDDKEKDYLLFRLENGTKRAVLRFVKVFYFSVFAIQQVPNYTVKVQLRPVEMENDQFITRAKTRPWDAIEFYQPLNLFAEKSSTYLCYHFTCCALIANWNTFRFRYKKQRLNGTFLFIPADIPSFLYAWNRSRFIDCLAIDMKRAEHVDQRLPLSFVDNVSKQQVFFSHNFIH